MSENLVGKNLSVVLLTPFFEGGEHFGFENESGALVCQGKLVAWHSMGILIEVEDLVGQNGEKSKPSHPKIFLPYRKVDSVFFD